MVAFFAVGALTTALVLVAWVVNIVEKTDATLFGGGLTMIGLIAGLATYRYNRARRPRVFPVHFRPQRAAEACWPHKPIRRTAGLHLGAHTFSWKIPQIVSSRSMDGSEACQVLADGAAEISRE